MATPPKLLQEIARAFGVPPHWRVTKFSLEAELDKCPVVTVEHVINPDSFEGVMYDVNQEGATDVLRLVSESFELRRRGE